MLHSNLNTRDLATQYNAQFGTKYTHKAFAQWLQKRKAKDIEVSTVNADLVTKVTAQVLEGEWVRQLNEIRENYTVAKSTNDVKAMTEWNRQAQFQVSMLLKAWQPLQVVESVKVITEEDRLSVIREFLEVLNDNERDNLRSALSRISAR